MVEYSGNFEDGNFENSRFQRRFEIRYKAPTGY